MEYLHHLWEDQQLQQQQQWNPAQYNTKHAQFAHSLHSDMAFQWNAATYDEALIVATEASTTVFHHQQQ